MCREILFFVIISFFSVFNAFAAPGDISTVVGNGHKGFDGDGFQALDASLANPNGVAADGQGNLFIGDEINSRIRKVDADGVITTIAGEGIFDVHAKGDGGQATAARLGSPQGVFVTANGDIYFADSSFHRIWKVDPSGLITIVAGLDEGGFSGDGGSATDAQLNAPEDVAIDSNGTIFIADSDNHRIRMIKSDGIILTIAGSGGIEYDGGGFSGDGGLAIEALLNAPQGVAVGPNGGIYIADSENHRIRRVRTDGIIETIAGDGESGYSGDGGPATQAKLYRPVDVLVTNNGIVYIADFYNHCVRRVDGQGNIETVAGLPTGKYDFESGGFEGDGGPATMAKFNRVNAIAFDLFGNLYVSDLENHRIRKIEAIENVEMDQSTIPGNFSGAGKTDVDGPGGTTNSVSSTVAGSGRESGYVYTVAGSGEFGIFETATFSGDGGLGVEAVLNRPEGIAIGPKGGIFIADKMNDRIRRVDPGDGTIVTVVGGGEIRDNGDVGLSTEVNLSYPHGLFFGGDGFLYFTTSLDNMVYKCDLSTSIITKVAGKGRSYDDHFQGDGGKAVDAWLGSPQDVYAYSDGTLLIADGKHHGIRRIGADGTISTIAGSGPFEQDAGDFSGDGGLATEARLNGPAAVTVGPEGGIYIADVLNHRIRKVNANGMISTIAGNGESGLYSGNYSGDGGPATVASLDQPTDVLVTNEGIIYIADSGNYCIRRIGSDGIISTVVGDNDAEDNYGIPQEGFDGDGGLSTEAKFDYLSGIVFDSSGNLYISDSGNHRVRIVIALEDSGAVTTPIISVDDGENGDSDNTTMVKLPSGSVGPVGLDLDISFGDQGVRQTKHNPSPGENITVDIFFTKGASKSPGYEIDLSWDPKEIEYISFSNRDIFSEAMAIPTKGDGKIKISNAIFGSGATANADSGTAGQAVFKIADTFSGVTILTLAGAKLESELVIGPGAKFVVIGGNKSQSPAEAANFDGDSSVGFGDFLIFASGFGLSSGEEGYNSRLDLDGNEKIGFGDFLMLASVFGQTV